MDRLHCFSRSACARFITIEEREIIEDFDAAEMLLHRLFQVPQISVETSSHGGSTVHSRIFPPSLRALLSPLTFSHLLTHGALSMAPMGSIWHSSTVLTSN